MQVYCLNNNGMLHSLYKNIDNIYVFIAKLFLKIICILQKN